MAVLALIALLSGLWLLRTSWGAGHASIATSNATLVNMLAVALGLGVMMMVPPAAEGARVALDPEVFSLGALTRVVLSPIYGYVLGGLGVGSWIVAGVARRRGVREAQAALAAGLVVLALGAGGLLLGIYVPVAQVAGAIQ